MTATPWGFRDILPEEAQAREEIALTVKGCFREHHYLPVETPLLEDKGSLEEGGRIADTPFKLFDDDGRLLVVRPDNTLPIVRLVSTRMRAADLPLRLRYEAPVVRECQRNAGGSRQFTQLGFELIGAGDTAGDVEIVSLVAEAVRKLALPDARIIAGSVRPFKELLAACEDRELAVEALRCVHANDFVGLDARVAASAEPEAVKAAISELPRLHGGAEVLDRVDALLAAAGIVAPLTCELRALVEGLAPEDAQVLSFDFSIMNSFDYYTGLVFKAYAGGLPDPVGSGGRYDSIFTGAFGDGIEVPAAGFAFSLERLEAARTSAEDAASDGDHAVGRGAEGPLRIAVPKGSLKADTLDVLEAAGLDVSELRDPGRHLIVRGRDTRAGEGAVGDIEFVIVRPSDAPAFVGCGGADCGICGWDSLIEAGLNLLQLVDLGYGLCTFIEAEPACRDHPCLARKRGHDCRRCRHGRRRRGREHRGARALGAALQGCDGPTRRHSQRRRHLCGRLELRATWRLRCRPQPHAADRRHGHVLQPAFGGGVRQALERYLLYARGPAFRRSRHAAPGRGRGPVGARAFGRIAPSRAGAGRGLCEC